MFINREISWLEFNQRVLNQARRQDLPLLERIKFLSITASNLDEFFQVRVGGLMLLQRAGKNRPELTGLTPTDELERIRVRANAMVAEQYELLTAELLPLMEQAGLQPLHLDDLDEIQLGDLEKYFTSGVAPLLTPLAMEVEMPPVLPNLSLVLAVELRTNGEPGSRMVAVTLPETLPRRVHTATLDKQGYVMLEELAARFISLLLPGEEVLGCTPSA